MKVYVIEYRDDALCEPIFLEAIRPLKSMTQKALKHILKRSKAMRYCYRRKLLQISPYNLIPIKGGK